MKLTYDQAVTLHKIGQLKRAESAYRELLEDPNVAVRSAYGLGVVLLQLGNAADALPYLEAASEENPSDVDLINALGAAYQQVGNYQAAKRSFEKSLNLCPSHPGALINLGVVLYQMGKFELSIVALEKVIHASPKNGTAYYNYSRSLLALGMLKESESAASKALELQPDAEEVNINLGVTQMSLGLNNKAEESYKSVLYHNPVSAEAHHNLAQIYLQTGKFEEGWKAFKWRWKTEDFDGAAVFQKIQPWDSIGVLPGRLLVWTEQGVGDQILFASMMPDLLDAVDTVIIACSERLVTLFSRSFPRAEVVSQSDLLLDGAALKAITHQVAVGDLGQFFRQNINCFDQEYSYLIAASEKVKTLRSVYKVRCDNKLLVGISWFSGNPRFGKSKSIDLLQLASQLSLPNVQLVSLQYGSTEVEIEKVKAAGIDIFRDADINALNNLDVFATQVKAMDLVITVSNTTAHFAGAMGVPCWTLLSMGLGKFWYWFLEREDSPWYPSVRLFRQIEPGDWSQVLAEMSEAFSKWSSSSEKIDN